MNLVGRIKVSNTEMFLFLHDVKDSETFILISPYHVEDRFRVARGEAAEHEVIRRVDQLKKLMDVNYVIESIKRGKKTGKVLKYGNTETIEGYIDLMGFAKSYKFSNDDISTQEQDIVGGKVIEEFTAASSDLQYTYSTVDSLLKYLRIQRASDLLELSAVKFSLKLDKDLYREVERRLQKRILVSSIKRIDYSVLEEVLDMSWYKDKDGYKKDYNLICSNEEFENKIFTPLIKKIIENKESNEPTPVAVDTETTGLNLYHLADDNPDKDSCVAIPICWEYGKSYVIFTDMAHFDNAENDYVMSRLEQLFDNFKGEREIIYYESNDDKVIERRVKIKRSDIILIGHNSGFDRRVFYRHHFKFWFDEDTLQMAFDIHPKSVRGSKSLKGLTRRIFNSETPELVDILGKGNEDKYRYLEDEEVAKIYGCADADFTLGTYFYLRKLMTKEMYYWYKRQDIPMINILAVSEYYGMNTIEDKVKILAEDTKRNIEILQNAMYSYVGVYLQYTNEINAIELKYKAGGFSSQEEYEAALNAVQPDPNAKYEFEFKPANLKQVIYEYMKYPIFAYTENARNGKKEPKLDKYVIKKMLEVKLEDGEEGPRRLTKDILKSGVDPDEYEALLESGKTKQAEKMVLISAKKFNSLRYPLALIIKEYSSLNKEYTSYYKPMETQNLEGKIFKSYNLARIETRRIANPGQTMKSDLKALIRSYTDDHYILDFDMSQVEYRIMASLSKATKLINKMKDPEADYHIETASMIEGIAPYLITKKQRKSAKHVGFGKPYGLGDRSLCEIMYGKVTRENLLATRLTIAKWDKANKDVVALLERARAQALTEWKISDELRDFMDEWKKDKKGNYVLDEKGNKIPIPISKVENMLHFYRTFELKGVDLSPEGEARRARGEYTSEESAIRRKAGNYPIQATASELFRLILIRFYQACEEYGIQDKIVWHMLIHDELLCSVKKDVHPFLIYKIVKKACMLTMKGHTNYFVGINMGDTWAEAKDDSHEAPIYFVDRMIERYEKGEFKDGWFDHPWDFIRPYLEQYTADRIGEVIEELQPGFRNGILDLESLLNEFENYTVRAYVNDYPMNGDIDYEVEEGNADSEARGNNLTWIKKLETWAILKYGEGLKFRDLDGNVYEVHKVESVSESTESAMTDDFNDDFDDFDDFFDDEEDDEDDLFSGNDVMSVFFDKSQDLSEVRNTVEDFQYDLSKTDAKDVNELTVVEHRFNNIQLLNEQVVISIKRNDVQEALEVILQPDTVKIGTRVVFRFNNRFIRWNKVKQNIDLDNLDDVISSLQSEPMTVCGSNLFLNIKLSKRANLLRKELEKYPGTDYVAYFMSNGKLGAPVKFSKKVDIQKIEKVVDDWR